MASYSTILSTALALAISANVVAEEIPVIELGVGSTPALSQPSANPHKASQNSELILTIQQLQDEVRALRGQIEQQDYRLKQMERQQLDRYRDLDGRISALQAAPSLGAVPSATNAPTLEQPPVAGAQARPALPAEPVIPPTPSVSGDDAKAYREAFALVKARNFPKAADAFSTFIKDFPNSARVVNAHYWLGEVYLAEQKPEQARESFLKVVSQYANDRKAPDAAYKLGIIYNQLGDKAKAVEYFDLVIKQYPESEAFRLAQEFKRQL